MHQNDFEGFRVQLGKLADVFGKKLTDETLQAYWGSLRDQSLTTVARLADQHMRYAKFFPKPFELRPKEERPKEQDPASVAAYKATLERSREGWDAWFARDPEMAEIELGIARAGRVLATRHPSTEEYRQASQEDFKYREARRTLGDQRRQEKSA